MDARNAFTSAAYAAETTGAEPGAIFRQRVGIIAPKARQYKTVGTNQKLLRADRGHHIHVGAIRNDFGIEVGRLAPISVGDFCRRHEGRLAFNDGNLTTAF